MRTSHKIAVAVLFFAIISFALLSGWFNSNKEIPTDHQITLDEAQHLQGNYDKFIEDGTLNNTPRLEYFTSEQVQRVTEQSGAYKFVIARAAHDNGLSCSVLYAVDKDYKKLPLILEKSSICPPFCPNNGLATK